MFTFNMISIQSERIITDFSAVNSRESIVDILYKRARNEHREYNHSGMKDKAWHQVGYR